MMSVFVNDIGLLILRVMTCTHALTLRESRMHRHLHKSSSMGMVRRVVGEARAPSHGALEDSPGRSI